MSNSTGVVQKEEGKDDAKDLPQVDSVHRAQITPLTLRFVTILLSKCKCAV